MCPEIGASLAIKGQGQGSGERVGRGHATSFAAGRPFSLLPPSFSDVSRRNDLPWAKADRRAVEAFRAHLLFRRRVRRHRACAEARRRQRNDRVLAYTFVNREAAPDRRIAAGSVVCLDGAVVYEGRREGWGRTPQRCGSTITPPLAKGLSESRYRHWMLRCFAHVDRRPRSRLLGGWP